MIMTMIAHVLSAKRTESIVITGMHDFVAHSVGGKMVEKNHHGVRIVTLGIFRGDSMTIKEQNAKELKRKWKEHLKRQAEKNAKSRKQKTMLGDPDKIRDK